MNEAAKTAAAPKQAADVENPMPQTTAAVSDLEQYFNNINNQFGNLIPQGWLGPLRQKLPEWVDFGGTPLNHPKVDIINRDEDIMVRADLPGVNKDDIEISVTDNTITLKGTTSDEKKTEKGDYFRRETMQGSFSRTMSLPSEVISENAKAEINNGVLEITIPKVVKAKRHTVKID